MDILAESSILHLKTLRASRRNYWTQQYRKRRLQRHSASLEDINTSINTNISINPGINTNISITISVNKGISTIIGIIIIIIITSLANNIIFWCYIVTFLGVQLSCCATKQQ